MEQARRLLSSPESEPLAQYHGLTFRMNSRKLPAHGGHTKDLEEAGAYKCSSHDSRLANAAQRVVGGCEPSYAVDGAESSPPLVEFR
jgi:hypothetical protein